ncbi:hypothetical protein Q9R38_14490 [Priestia aryabhattai]|uniref:hypothetical protein n=1 Tax=Priestia aryabhattai TaxID=412384 RepID=UPI00064E9C1C|nr:hypothetical protein [Priestia aryabhattai]KML31420.1 hypothetical protein VL11_02380 [Priestia aryabhattai]KMN93136.1 hypothetical protein ABV89_26230 [Priestia aryabhattai]MDT0147723.1 hypothetical protein [Priestia aryabhattai]MDT0154410.1 hypothetical protein [Priestia aryabhattai]MED4000287.1 hypothetical protein [Priestia aryabhattai]
MNTILEDFYELREILSSFDSLQNNYNWLLTGLDGSLPDVYLDYFIDYRTYSKEARGSTYWITGEKLTELANKEDIYFAWGVFSAFNKNEHIDLDMLKEEPYADGNPDFWVERPKIQHPKATTELVLWDAELVLLLSKDERISTTFRNKFKDFKSLEVYNKEPF